MVRVLSLRSGSLGPGLAAALVAVMASVLFALPDGSLRASIGLGGHVVGYAIGGACAVMGGLAGRHAKRARVGWLLIGSALIGFCVGDAALWFGPAQGSSASAGVPTLALLGAAYVALMTGMWLLPQFERRGDAFKLVVECAMVALGLSIAGWHFMIRGMWAASGAALAHKCLAVGQPAGDLIAVACAFTFATSSSAGEGLRKPARLVAIAAALALAADSALCIQVVNNGVSSTGPWIDLSYVGCGLLSGNAALLAWRASLRGSSSVFLANGVSSSPYRFGLTAAFSYPLTYGPLLLALIVFSTSRVTSDGPDTVELVLTAILLVAAVARRAILERENAELARRLYAAEVDPLTGLPNHKAISQALEHELDVGSERNEPLGVLVMDVENFRLFNNTHGYQTGDLLLKQAADVLRRAPEITGMFGRYGGDEFLAILPGADERSALAAATRLRALLGQETFRWSEDCIPVPLRLSFGVATYPGDGTTRLELLDAAHANLELAKQADRGVQASGADKRTERILVSDSGFSVLDALVAAVDNKDRYTRKHSEDVAKYAVWIAEELEWTPEQQRSVHVGALLHDVGKIGIPMEILRKPAELTRDEFGIVKRHPEFGAAIASAVPGGDAILDAIRYHHERWDGAGYPDCLAGEEIPIVGRLIAVADAVSAMTMDRPYRKGLSWDAALRQVRAGSGTHFDPEMVSAFFAAVEHRSLHLIAA